MNITQEQIDCINTLADLFRQNEVNHGFSPDTDPLSQYIPETTSNMHGEVSEFWEGYRKKILFEPCDKKGCDITNGEEELADLVIRAFATAKRLGLNIGRGIALKHGYNVDRPYRHGDKAA